MMPYGDRPIPKGVEYLPPNELKSYYEIVVPFVENDTLLNFAINYTIANKTFQKPFFLSVNE